MPLYLPVSNISHDIPDFDAFLKDIDIFAPIATILIYHYKAILSIDQALPPHAMSSTSQSRAALRMMTMSRELTFEMINILNTDWVLPRLSYLLIFWMLLGDIFWLLAGWQYSNSAPYASPATTMSRLNERACPYGYAVSGFLWLSVVLAMPGCLTIYDCICQPNTRHFQFYRVRTIKFQSRA